MHLGYIKRNEINISLSHIYKNHLYRIWHGYHSNYACRVTQKDSSKLMAITGNSEQELQDILRDFLEILN